MKVESGGLGRAVEHYHALTSWKLVVVAASIVLLTATVSADVLTGAATLRIADVLAALLDPARGDGGTNAIIVWTLRLPSALMAVVVGASLAVAGAEIQTVLDNPVAEPYTLGLSSAAGFGAALAILHGSSLAIDPDTLGPAAAFAAAAVACGLIYAIAHVRGGTSDVMLLAGIAVLFLFQALLALMQYRASPEALQAIVFWLFGSLSRASWIKVGIIAATFAATVPVLARDAWKLTALRLGEARALALGVRVRALRLRVFGLVSLLTAVAVCFAGTIGFVGLVAPHLARMLVGEDQRFLLPLSALFGAVLLSAASIASKTIVPGALYPIGIVTALVGVPFFVLLICRMKRGYW
ncbi:MAG: iron ABC transporter permease [Alphaproteobacteria bacterium]